MGFVEFDAVRLARLVRPEREWDGSLRVEVRFGDRWFGIVKLVNLLDDPDARTVARLFEAYLANDEAGAARPRRGLPDDVSEEARQDRSEDAADPTLDARWDTWTGADALAQDIALAQQPTASRADAGWRRVVRLAQVLVEEYGPECVRVVAWLG